MATPPLTRPPPPVMELTSLVALNDALQSVPADRLRDVIRSVCLSNLEVAVLIHDALCGVEAGDGGGQGSKRKVGNDSSSQAAKKQKPGMTTLATRTTPPEKRTQENTRASGTNGRGDYGGDDDSSQEEEDSEEEGEDSEDENACDCVYHPGSLAADEDAFADHDERVHGPIDSEDNMREFPESFIWDYCDQDGNADGCKMGRHTTEGRRMTQYADLQM